MNKQSKTELVPFHGHEIVAINHPEHGPCAAIHRMCETLKLSFWSQLRKLKAAPWGRVVMMTTHDTTGRTQEMAFLPKDQIPMWMATIIVSKVAPECRELLTLFQIEARDVLAKHFMGTPIIQTPKAPSDQLEINHQLAQLLTSTIGQQMLDRQRIASVEVEMASLKEDLQDIKQKNKRAEDKLWSLPKATASIEDMSLATLVNQRVKTYGVANYWGGKQYSDAWNRLYSEFELLYHVGIRAIYRHNPQKYQSLLDVVRGLDPELQAKFHALSCKLFPTPPEMNA